MKEPEVLEFAKHKMSEIKERIKRIEQQIEILRQKQLELEKVFERWGNLAEELSHEVAGADAEATIDLTSARLADACYSILKTNGHGLHARELVLELERSGRIFDAKNPVDSVHKMLLRDRRFHRPGDRGSYWELEEWELGKLEETEKAVMK